MSGIPEFTVNESGVAINLPTGKVLTLPTGTVLAAGQKLGSSGASAAGAILMGVGTTADPSTTAVADKNFIESRTQSTATSGTSRALYMRHNIAGAGETGECIRAFTDLTAAVTTGRGAQISLQVGSTGYVSGLGAGVDAQLYLKNSVLPANGTYAALNVEIYSEGSTTAVSAVTELAWIRIANSGDATGVGRVSDKAYLFDLTGFTSGAAKTWYDHQGTAPTNVEEWLKCKTPAGDRWLPLYNAVV